jgi:hypothetical protein
VTQVERQRLLQDHHVDTLTELRAQQRLRKRQAALRAGNRGHQHPFQKHQAQYPQRVVIDRATRGHDRIDDLRTDPGNAGRQQARDDGQHRQREQQQWVGIPHQRNCTPAVAKDTEEAARQVRITQARATARRAPGGRRVCPVRVHAISSALGSGS